MKYLFPFFLCFLLNLYCPLYSQQPVPNQNVTLSGYITNKANNETLIGVSINIPEAQVGSTTNSYGFYSITLPKGNYTIQISYVGFASIEEKISLSQNSKLNFQLSESSNTLDEVLVKSNVGKINIQKPEMSSNKLSIATIKKMPAVLGEVDVLKSILQLPGVSTAQEGASGFNVRGGAVDGNLVLLDEATIYNSSHLFGFFSVFNSDVIKDLKLYKGGIPAQYGGRSSSVLDIYQKEGNNKNYQINGGIGAISSRLLVEGPILKERTSFVLAGRASYGHLFLKMADQPNAAYFYDLNTKINHKINDRNNLFLSGYFGNDIISLNNSLKNNYGNTFLNLRWNHIYSDKIFSNASMIYSKYNYGLQLKFIGLDWQSDIKNYNLKYDFKHYLSNKLSLNYGWNAIYYQFNPGTIRPFGETSNIQYNQIAKKYALENALYFSVEQKLSEKLSFNYGLRYSHFLRLGQEDVNVYANNQAVLFNTDFQIYESATAIGIKSYNKNEKIARFDNFEPRLSAAYSFNPAQSIKASYTRMTQYIHLISNTTAASPLDIWSPSDGFLLPEIADQVALGYFQNFSNDKFSLEVETFYKKIKNKADYIDGAELIANEAIERVLLNGRARAYGLEVLAKKNTGKFTGWLSYTLSRSEQQTPGRSPEETGLNQGEWYRSNYDKLHNLSLTTAYSLSKKWLFSGIFTYQTGKAASFPNGKYQYQDMVIANYGLRNKNSLSAYHHLDLAATYVPKPDKIKGWQSEWVFSIYNVYNRPNAASYVFGQSNSTAASEVSRISIFGIVPSITYNFKY